MTIRITQRRLHLMWRCRSHRSRKHSLDKLKLNIRSLIAAQEEDSKDLLDLCIDVIYHNNMKAFGLQQLIKLYLQWLSLQDTIEEE